ncbi:MAG: hypothetical protein sL5_03200 [Candidatus Mesenet longicola]|uniref:Uncharacterized protein n=1 Tax=Candidatus Mesenet longicola TaxID=1892558 RepID=A0A8J3MMM9_9RICK|nr:MAG: hypothetical protein sGL2_03330 [Candidatus Mesenet longicola]GHM59327.1 MAG: hypothetical protein sL5_03200 [Candidatus Mesenet longicola]
MLSAVATTTIGSIALKDKLSSKKSMIKILIFALCLPAINALAIWACSQLSHLKGAFEMTSLTLMIVAAACIFILPELFSKTKSSENISDEKQLPGELTSCGFTKEAVTQCDVS